MVKTATKTKETTQDTDSIPNDNTENTRQQDSIANGSKKSKKATKETTGPTPEQELPSSKTRGTEAKAAESSTVKEKTAKPAAEPTVVSSNVQITCSQEKLQQGLSLVALATPTKPTHPILANTLLVADAKTQEVTLKVFDLSVGIQTKFSTNVVNGGELTLPVGLLAEIVERFDSRSTINFNVTGEENNPVASIKAESGNYQIKGIPAIEFPPLPEIASGSSISLPIEVLKNAIKRSIFAASIEETKQVLNGIHLTVDKEIVRFAATDGHRLAIVETPTQGIGKNRAEIELFEFTCPRTTLLTLERMLAMLSSEQEDSKSAPAPIEITYDSISGILAFTTAGTQLLGRCLSGNYPDYQQLLPREFKRQAVVEKRVLIKALERIGILTEKKEKTVKVEFNYEEQEMRISIERDFGSGIESIPAGINGDGLTLGFNLKYLLDGVKQVPTSEVQFELTTETAPAVLVPFGNSDNPAIRLETKYLLMPLQIHS